MDAVVKKAPVTIHVSQPMSPGHFIIVFSGGVAEVEESLEEGIREAGDFLLGNVFLPQIHPQVPQAITGAFEAQAPDLEAIAILETFTVATTIVAADAACKAAPVRLVQMRLGQGLGGKAFFMMTGELHDLEAGVEAAEESIGMESVMNREVIPRPHPDFIETTK